MGSLAAMIISALQLLKLWNREHWGRGAKKVAKTNYQEVCYEIVSTRNNCTKQDRNNGDMLMDMLMPKGKISQGLSVDKEQQAAEDCLEEEKN